MHASDGHSGAHPEHHDREDPMNSSLGAVLRVLLPGHTPDGTLHTWSDIATTTGYPRAVDGYTDWTELVELRPGTDVARLPSAAAGWVDPITAGHLTTALDSPARRPWTWFAGAHSPARASSAQPFVSLTQLLATLQHHYHGQAISGDAAVSIRAPRYADSLLVTGPPTLLHDLRSHGLEAHPVNPDQPIAIWVD